MSQILTHRDYPLSQPSGQHSRSGSKTLTRKPRIRSTPRDPSRRPTSFSSVDSGYASTEGQYSNFDPMRNYTFGKKHIAPPHADVCEPLVPISYTSADTSKPAFPFLQKRKKSPNDLPSDSLPMTSWRSPDTFQIETNVSNLQDEELDNMQAMYSPAKPCQPKHHFATKLGMIHHPYPIHQAPYMQGYDRTLLDTDRFSDILLQRLCTNGTPSFLTFNGKPPTAILDLGCGAGHWAIRAARHWPIAKIIGIDLITPTRLNDAIATPPNVEWRQMNFIGRRLGFPSDTFDLVRMANLSLCIPAHRWSDVLNEVKRVLTPGGRLELIDDQIIFPIMKPLERPRVVPDVINICPSDIDMSTDSDSSSFDDDCLGSDDDFKSTRSQSSSIYSQDEEAMPYDADSEWLRNKANAKVLEVLFAEMLWRKYSIRTDQRGSIEDVLDNVFGRYNSQRVAALTLAIAPPAFSSTSEPDQASPSSADSKSSKKKRGEAFKQWMTTECDKKGDRSSRESVPSPIPRVISLKAAGRLGISPPTAPSPIARSPRTPVSPPPSRPTQSPGLVLWPNTLIELESFELEMHACKHMQSLLGCKAALHEYTCESYRDSEGNPLLDDVMLDDLIWDYECFRRKRFNWPSMIPETGNSTYEEPTVAPNSRLSRLSADLTMLARSRGVSDASMKQSESSHYFKDELTFVRSIYVYTAIKIAADDIFLS